MYLSDLLIVNYKSCRKLKLTFEAETPNVFIGINDCGKSTILQAIGLLLDAKPKFNYLQEDHKKTDISNTRITPEERQELFDAVNIPDFDCQPDDCLIVGGFTLEDADIDTLNNDEYSNHILWVVENSTKKKIWLARKFETVSQKASEWLLTPDHTGEPRELYKARDNQINKVRQDLGIPDDEIRNENKAGRFTKLEKIRAIYNKLKPVNQWVEYRVDKNIWPQYRYLDWNMSMEQLNQVVNDILESHIEAHVNEARQFARQQADKSQEIVNAELEKLAGILSRDVPTIERLKANIHLPVKVEVTDILLNKVNADGDIHLESQGDGIKRQLWFALLKWKSIDQAEIDSPGKKFLWCFDEPETHLYPKAQRDFYEIIKKISASNVQTILSTHSTIFIDRAKLKYLKKVDLMEGYTEVAVCQNVDDIFHTLQLRNSDFLFHDYFLAVEGDTEMALIPHLYQIYFQRTLQEDNIQPIPLGGKDKRYENHRTLERVLADFRKDSHASLVYILDKDAVFSFTRHELEGMRRQVYLVGNQDIEDSLSAEIWCSFVQYYYEGKLDISIEEINRLRADIPVANPNCPDSELSSNRKFYPRLKRLVREKTKERELAPNLLPEKGKDSGEALCKFISKKDQIPMDIIQAFNHINAQFLDQENFKAPLRF